MGKWASMKLSRSSILTALVALVVLASLPAAIGRLIDTGNPYLFTKDFFHDMLARLSGPGRLRFILQPAMAIFLGIRHGLKDSRANLPSFLWALVVHVPHRQYLLRDAVTGVRDLVAVAVLLDIASQALIFHEIHPGAALLVGPVLIAIPYSLSRSLANRRQAPPRSRATAARSS
jgi:hypothetical protein